MKEVQPIVMGTVMWGVQWYGRSVKCQCDNAVVGAIIWSGTTRDEWAMHLMKCLFFFVAKLCGQSTYQEDVMGQQTRCLRMTKFLSCHKSPQHSKNQLRSQSNWPRSWCTNSQTGHPGAVQNCSKVFLKVYSVVPPEHPEDGG